MLKAKAEKQDAAEKAETKEKSTGKKSTSTRKRSTRQSPMEAMIKSAARTIGSQMGRQIIRGILGSLFGKR